MHGLPPSAPRPLELTVTTPVGVVAVPAAVSVTVAVHVDGVPTATVPGEQLTLVEVERAGTTVTNVVPKLRRLAECFASPLYSNLTVPVGLVCPLLSVSVTVAVHVTDWPTATVSGEQLTAVEVESGAVYVRLTKPVGAGSRRR